MSANVTAAALSELSAVPIKSPVKLPVAVILVAVTCVNPVIVESKLTVIVCPLALLVKLVPPLTVNLSKFKFHIPVPESSAILKSSSLSRLSTYAFNSVLAVST